MTIAIPFVFGSLGWGEILIITLIILLLFGAKRIPELMKSVGKGVKSFKEGINEIDEQINQVDDKKPEPKEMKTDETVGK